MVHEFAPIGFLSRLNAQSVLLRWEGLPGSPDRILLRQKRMERFLMLDLDTSRIYSRNPCLDCLGARVSVQEVNQVNGTLVLLVGHSRYGL